MLRKFLLEQDNDEKIKHRRAFGVAYANAVEEFCFLIPEIQKISDGDIENSDIREMLNALGLGDFGIVSETP